jgi:uncharacterized membrane protein required for colicin V production
MTTFIACLMVVGIFAVIMLALVRKDSVKATFRMLGVAFSLEACETKTPEKRTRS